MFSVFNRWRFSNRLYKRLILKFKPHSKYKYIRRKSNTDVILRLRILWLKSVKNKFTKFNEK